MSTILRTLRRYRAYEESFTRQQRHEVFQNEHETELASCLLLRLSLLRRLRRFVHLLSRRLILVGFLRLFCGVLRLDPLFRLNRSLYNPANKQQERPAEAEDDNEPEKTRIQEKI